MSLNDIVSEEESGVAGRWLKWCMEHQKVKVTSFEVPEGILPVGLNGILHDVKVQDRKWGPDDRIYSKDADLRAKVARGNCVLEVQNTKDGKRNVDSRYLFVIFALRKFSGGLGDEDDSEAQSMWQNYFIKPLSSASKVVCIVKANGEAGHISSFRIAGQNYFACGSKNVHLIARDKADVERYSDSRFNVAQRVANTFFNKSKLIDPEKFQNLIEYLQSTRYTMVVEILQPDYQHVVNLSHLKECDIAFICFTETYKEEEHVSLCPMPPNQCIDKAREFGLTTIDYNVIDAAEAEEEMARIRETYGIEGKVLYYVDEDDNVFGIIKKKTVWYIILRAIREKAAAFASAKSSAPLSDVKTKVSKRIKEIQNWIGFSNEMREKWTELGYAFIVFARKGQLQNSTNIRANFPILWQKFLKANEQKRAIYTLLNNFLMLCVEEWPLLIRISRFSLIQNH